MADNKPEEVEKTEQPHDERKEFEKSEEEKKADRVAWLRFALLHILVLIPIVTGVACLIAGNKTDNDTLTFAGKLVLEAGVPGVIIILVIAVLIWKFHGVRKAEPDTSAADKTHDDETNEQAPSQIEHEQNAINAVNSTNYMSSRVKLAEYEAAHVAEGMKHAPKWGMPVGIGIFLLLVADIVGATVLAIKGIFVGTIICAALFAGVVITGLIVMSVSRAKAMNGDISKAKKITEGKVKACFMIGTTTTRTGGNHRYQSTNGRTVRIHGVTYRVIVIADGKEYGTFSKRFYETGENVTVAVMSKNRAKIVEPAELENLNRPNDK